MNNEILEISQWLHEKGFEPDASWNEPSVILLQYFDASEKEQILENMEQMVDAPYFTLGHVLELLPHRVNEFCLAIGKDLPNVYSVGYFKACGNVPDFDDSLLIEIESDLHLSALRLLKKTVEEGYVKAN